MCCFIFVVLLLDGLVIHGQRCASRCPDGQEPNTHRVCVPCKGACPKGDYFILISEMCIYMM